ncbi:hypothetical protein BKA62DRAFT_63002 [Auriculariales sp. MPI-PUGE-AT-0066]|nr:hypothetical protein BKA62DRAFT_63002 [Auriculariales sp. MPI-PUGE-AT-0066]
MSTHQISPAATSESHPTPGPSPAFNAWARPLPRRVSGGQRKVSASRPAPRAQPTARKVSTPREKPTARKISAPCDDFPCLTSFKPTSVASAISIWVQRGVARKAQEGSHTDSSSASEGGKSVRKAPSLDSLGPSPALERTESLAPVSGGFTPRHVSPGWIEVTSRKHKPSLSAGGHKSSAIRKANTGHAKSRPTNVKKSGKKTSFVKAVAKAVPARSARRRSSDLASRLSHLVASAVAAAEESEQLAIANQFPVGAGATLEIEAEPLPPAPPSSPELNTRSNKLKAVLDPAVRQRRLSLSLSDVEAPVIVVECKLPITETLHTRVVNKLEQKGSSSNSESGSEGEIIKIRPAKIKKRKTESLLRYTLETATKRANQSRNAENTATDAECPQSRSHPTLSATSPPSDASLPDLEQAFEDPTLCSSLVEVDYPGRPDRKSAFAKACKENSRKQAAEFTLVLPTKRPAVAATVDTTVEPECEESSTDFEPTVAVPAVETCPTTDAVPTPEDECPLPSYLASVIASVGLDDLDGDIGNSTLHNSLMPSPWDTPWSAPHKSYVMSRAPVTPAISRLSKDPWASCEATEPALVMPCAYDEMMRSLGPHRPNNTYLAPALFQRSPSTTHGLSSLIYLEQMRTCSPISWSSRRYSASSLLSLRSTTSALNDPCDSAQCCTPPTYDDNCFACKYGSEVQPVTLLSSNSYAGLKDGWDFDSPFETDDCIFSCIESAGSKVIDGLRW